MSKKVIVSIISEHNIPNISLILNKMDCNTACLDILTKTSENEYYDRYINAITDDKTSYITDNFNSIKVDESDPENIKNQLLLKTSLFDEAEIIYVNVTGGTKPLALFTYNFFKEKYKEKSKFYYMNIVSSSNMFIDLDKNEKEEMKNVLTLKQYLRSYNYQFKDELINIDKDEFEKASIILKEYTDKQHLNVRSMLNTLLNMLKKYLKNKKAKQESYDNSFKIKNAIDELQEKYINNHKYQNNINILVNNKDKICNFIDDIAQRLNNYHFKNSTNMDIKTLTFIISEFLEKYIYYIIKSEIFDYSNKQDIVNDNLKHSLKLYNVADNDKSKNTEHELDVLFSYNNLLCYIECKSSANSELIKSSTIKQKAISSKFGIKSYNIFIVLNEETNEEQNIKKLEEKANKFNVEIVMKEDLLNGNFIKKLKEYCNIK